MQGAQVRSRVMELRSHLLHGVAKQQQTNNNKKKKNYLKKSKIVGNSGTEQVVIRMWHMVGVAMSGGKILIPDLRQGYSDARFRVTQ